MKFKLIVLLFEVSCNFESTLTRDFVCYFLPFSNVQVEKVVLVIWGALFQKNRNVANLMKIKEKLRVRWDASSYVEYLSSN